MMWLAFYQKLFTLNAFDNGCNIWAVYFHYYSLYNLYCKYKKREDYFLLIFTFLLCIFLYNLFSFDKVCVWDIFVVALDVYFVDDSSSFFTEKHINKGFQSCYKAGFTGLLIYC